MVKIAVFIVDAGNRMYQGLTLSLEAHADRDVQEAVVTTHGANCRVVGLSLYSGDLLLASIRQARDWVAGFVFLSANPDVIVPLLTPVQRGVSLLPLESHLRQVIFNHSRIERVLHAHGPQEVSTQMMTTVSTLALAQHYVGRYQIAEGELGDFARMLSEVMHQHPPIPPKIALPGQPFISPH